MSPDPTPTEIDWHRLDRRMLLVHPIKDLFRSVPVLFGIVVVGGLADHVWLLLSVAAPLILGVVRYLTTTYRITDTRVELRHGLLHRHNLSTPIDRVRTVDLTASPIHRLLGLATVVIGTGSVAKDEDERLRLDALPRPRAVAVRTQLLGAPAHPQGYAGSAAVDRGVTVARFSPRWLWYAPINGTLLVAAAAAWGAVAPYIDRLHFHLDRAEASALHRSLVVLLVAAPFGLVVLLVAAYLIANGGFLLTRQRATWHVSRGLLTQRETTIDVARLAGVRIGEPAVLRLTRGGRITAIVTGLGRKQQSSTVLLPPAPRSTTVATATAVLGDAAPVSGPLRRHGSAATTRRFSRALLGAAPIVLAVAGAILAGAPAQLGSVALAAILVALALAADRARSLGHGHLGGHVVTRGGSLLRHRDAVADRHVIGWTHRATWFQRRVGLVSVAATTAGGRGLIGARDVPVSAAIALARAATPGLIEEFLTDPAESTTLA